MEEGRQVCCRIFAFSRSALTSHRYLSRTHGSQPPWSPESEFAALDSDLKMWRRELPDFVEYSADTIYARLDSNQLGALVVIHCTYHYSYLELYKVSMPDLFKLRKSFTFPPEHVEFLQSIQAECYHHAQRIATILAEAAQHGSRLLSDGLLPFFVYDSSRVILYYVSRLLDPNRTDAQAKMKEAVKAVESNNRLLREMSPLSPIADSLVSYPMTNHVRQLMVNSQTHLMDGWPRSGGLRIEPKPTTDLRPTVRRGHKTICKLSPLSRISSIH